ncbi:MAG: NAD(P)H-dependent oxidoreductase subunit E [Clostridiales bacterium]|nr:NAD(P)H-dependent oxidoreductase subunit E [Clostridiales bacterium]
MSTKFVSSVPFTGTKEQEKALQEVIARHKGQQGAVMPAMQEAQDIYGYLPEEVQIMLAEGLNVPLEHIYGIATFYSQFNLNPKGRFKVGVCLGTACYVRGASAVFEKISEILGIENGGCTEDGKFSLDATRCLGCCGLAPVMMINDDVFGRLSVDNVAAIFDRYKDQ